MAAYVQWKGSLCDGCGVKADVASDPYTTFSVTDSICWGCRVKEDKAAELSKAAEKNKTPGAVHGVKVYISNAKRNPREAVADGGSAGQS
jgi:hypothetical protein